MLGQRQAPTPVGFRHLAVVDHLAVERRYLFPNLGRTRLCNLHAELEFGHTHDRGVNVELRNSYRTDTKEKLTGGHFSPEPSNTALKRNASPDSDASSTFVLTWFQ